MTLIDRLRQQARNLKAEAFTLYYAYRDPRTPWPAKALIALTLGYLFSPIDLIPDFIPVLGLLDDLLLVPLLIRLSLRLIPAVVIAESRLKAQARTGEQRPTNWWFVGVIVCIWAGAVYGLYRWAKSR
ncbi:YkvA family protein [Spirosoma utsteinense]|uniref:YkvA family protein n=1 Tax=Spirosoma utsteinense TaxID=2585773 RepID=UPI001648E22A|nr:DUF1232 domain-containing protein [Spirosoma utsteinense]MBC3787772.1 putative membrane protein YkvA (DUF1232 family) [Spirosoma utsteinense]